MLGAGYTRSQVLAGRQLSSERKPLGNGHLTPGPESPGSGPKGSRAPLAHRPGRCSQKGRHAHGCRVPPSPLGRASRHSERATRQSVVARTNHQLQDLKLSDQYVLPFGSQLTAGATGLAPVAGTKEPFPAPPGHLQPRLPPSRTLWPLTRSDLLPCTGTN